MVSSSAIRMTVDGGRVRSGVIILSRGFGRLDGQSGMEGQAESQPGEWLGCLPRPDKTTTERLTRRCSGGRAARCLHVLSMPLTGPLNAGEGVRTIEPVLI